MTSEDLPTPLTSSLASSLALHDGKIVLSLVGELDRLALEQFRTLMLSAVTLTPTEVVVDTSGLEMIDAAALGVLVSAAEQLHSRGAHLAVHTVPGPVHRLVGLAGLTTVLGVGTAKEGTGLIGALAAGAGAPRTRDLLDAAMKLVVTMAAAVVSGADGVSITLPRQGSFRTVAASNDVVLGMDHDQYRTGEGPCLSAATNGERYYIASLAAEDRWPAFVPLAQARGIHSILSTPLRDDRDPLGALNIYSRTAGGLAPHELGWADQFAREASDLLVAAQTHNGSPEEPALAGELQRGLLSRETIALAQGIIMEREGISATAAYVDLMRVSHRTSHTLREVCQQILDTAGHGQDAQPSTDTAAS